MAGKIRGPYFVEGQAANGASYGMDLVQSRREALRVARGNIAAGDSIVYVWQSVPGNWVDGYQPATWLDPIFSHQS